jgi:cytochrome c oxidase subunit 2
MEGIPLLPPRASAAALEFDLLYFFLTGVTAFFVVLVGALVVYFAIKYRRRHPDEVGADIHGSLVLELTWTFIPLVISMVMFAWGASLFYRMSKPPADSMDLYVVGKQWMWKVQHPEGIREINEMHVPINRNVRLTIGSEDVIHAYGIPAFRVKMDAVPGRLTTAWFRATVPGRYHIFCDQYCGTNHSRMVGEVIAMEPEEYEAWLASGAGLGSGPTAIAVVGPSGEQLFTDFACISCHREDGVPAPGPPLTGVAGSARTLADGSTVVADDNYLRESILNSQAEVVAGFPPVMPVFQGMLSEEQVLSLIAYIKSLQ